MYRAFKAFENILIYAKKNNIEIFNCSTRGILDIFKHKKFEKAVNEKIKAAIIGLGKIGLII